LLRTKANLHLCELFHKDFAIYPPLTAFDLLPLSFHW